MKIALIAHEHLKDSLVSWVRYNKESLTQHSLIATEHTGKRIMEEIGIPNITLVNSGPTGGDQQIGSLIASAELNLLIFFWDPLSALPHDPDVKGLLRLSVLYNIPTACNRTTADYIISSPLFLLNE